MASKGVERTKSIDIDVKGGEDKKAAQDTVKPSPGAGGAARGGSPKKDVSDLKDKINSQPLLDQLHDAVRDGDYKLVEYIIKKNVDNINARGQFGDTALHWAVMGGTPAHDKIVRKLVADQADVNLVGARPFTDNHTPLHLAASRGSEQCMKLLLTSKTVDFNMVTTHKETPLHKAAMAGRESNVKKLLEMGADINLQDMYGNTALHHGAYSGDHSVVNRLMQAGASRNTRNNVGERPADVAKTPGIAQLIYELSPDREDFYQETDEEDFS